MKQPRLDAVDLTRGSLDAVNTLRYAKRAILGRGGMGEVRLCRDHVVGRDVALKVMLAPRDDKGRKRFLHEALVQGQLEHPAIPPLYDLGEHDGEAYFTMKCLRGRTLQNLLDAHRAGNSAVVEAFPIRRLLAAMASVCLAVDYAHQRGVVHRDIKPSNVMLGFFGEVTVLDWGIAKVGIDPTVRPPSSPSLSSAARGDHAPTEVAADGEVKTKAGEFMGTVGYMAPEQARGLPLSPRADVYALGAMLFEVLTLEPLHERTNPTEMLYNTVSGAVSARPSERCPDRDVPVELGDLCVAATATDPQLRLASARALSEGITRFLDGERDAERRRQLAEEHAEAAKAFMRQALGEEGDNTDRSRALNEAGRALALDAENVRAREVLVGLLTAPPPRPPPEVLDDLAASAQARLATQARSSILGAIGVLAVLLLGMVSMGLRDWRVAPALAVAVVVAVGTLYANTRSARPRLALTLVEVLSRIVALGLVGRIFGPLVLMPGLFTIAALSYALSDDPLRARVGGGLTLLGFLAVVGLDVAGVLSSSYAFGEGMTVSSTVVALHAAPSLTVLTAASIVMIGAPFAMMRRMREQNLRAERATAVRAWQLRQLAAAPSNTEKSRP